MESVDVIAAALAQMAAFRGATVSGQTLALFAQRLVTDGVSVDDAVAACGRLESSERADGESAFPSLGTLHRVIGQVRADRYREATAARRRLAAGSPVSAVPEMTRDEARAFVGRLKADVRRRLTRAV